MKIFHNFLIASLVPMISLSILVGPVAFAEAPNESVPTELRNVITSLNDAERDQAVRASISAEGIAAINASTSDETQRDNSKIIKFIGNERVNAEDDPNASNSHFRANVFPGRRAKRLDRSAIYDQVFDEILSK